MKITLDPTPEWDAEMQRILDAIGGSPELALIRAFTLLRIHVGIAQRGDKAVVLDDAGRTSEIVLPFPVKPSASS